MWKQARERNKRLRKMKKQGPRIMNGAWYDEKRGYLHEWSVGRAGGLTVHAKRESNRRFRHNNKLLETRNKGLHHKNYDYWWTIF